MTEGAPEPGDLRWCLRGCLWTLLSIVIGFGWLYGTERVVWWYMDACGADLDGGESFAYLFFLVLKLGVLIMCAGVGHWAVLTAVRRLAPRGRVVVAASVLVGAVLVTWGFVAWEIVEGVIPISPVHACWYDDPPGWPAFVPIPR